MRGRAMDAAVVVLIVLILAVEAAGGSLAGRGAALPGVLEAMRTVRDSYRAASDALRIRDVEFTREPVPQFGKLEVTFHLDATYTNPFDPDEVDVVGELTLPDGKTVSVPAFHFVPFRPTSGVTQLQGGIPFGPAGAPCWKLRFSPPIAGDYHFRILAREASGRSSRTGSYPFSAAPSGRPGFVRVSESSPRYFEDTANGSLFLGVGSNVAWTRTGDPGDPVASYEYYFGRAKGLMSATRVWMCHWAWLEWTPQVVEPGTTWMGYAGVGYYNQMIAAEFDRVFDLAEQNGLRVMLVTEDNNEQFESGGAEEWLGNPYNAANGGPCREPAEVFSSAEARRLYRMRLRYIIARWGYSTSLWAINSWNDESETSPEVRDWLKEMHDYVHDLVRGYRPIVYGSNFRANDLMDYAQAGAGELVRGKPNVVQECEFTDSREWFVPMLRESLWSGLARGMAAVMVWPHAMVDRLDAWGVFSPPLKFFSGLRLNQRGWAPIEAEAVSATASTPGDLMRVLTVWPAGDVPEWGARASASTFTINLRDGSHALEGLGATLYGDGGHKAEWRNPPAFLVNMPGDGELVMEVEEIGGGDQLLAVTVDGRPAAQVRLAGGRRELRDDERWVRVSVPKGSHRVSVDNAQPGGDWVRVRRYHFTSRERDAGRLVTARGLSDGEHGFLYVQNQTYARLPQDLGQPPVQMAGVRLTASGLRDGHYRVSFFDTVTGAEARTEEICRNGSLPIQIARLGADLAIKMERIAPAGQAGPTQ